MIAIIYQGWLKPGMEKEYCQLWNEIATFFKKEKGAIGSCLHKTKEGLWVAYSRWPNQETRDTAWPPSTENSTNLPEEIFIKISRMKECIQERLPEICMEVVDNLL